MSTFRNHLMKNAKGALPYDAEVEYLETDVKAGERILVTIDYIVSGNDVDIYTSFMPLGFTLNQWEVYFAAYTDGAKQTYLIRRYGYGTSNGDKLDLNNGGNPNSWTLVDFRFNEKYDVAMLGKERRYSFNEQEGNLVQPYLNKLNIENLYFCSDMLWRMYMFKVVKNGNVELDLIPVRKGNEGFMYDKVSGKLYGNQGTGRFILGPDKK